MDRGEAISILGGAVQLYQVEDGFQTGLDSVMLAAASPAEPGSAILDIGCGVGGASFALLHRVKDTTLCGVDFQEECIDYAHANAEMNGMVERTQFVYSDIRDFERREYNHVICNPPYMRKGTYLKSPSAKRDVALGHKECALVDWVKCAFECLEGRGSLTMIHRADAVNRVVLAYGKMFGDMEIIPLWPKAGQPAKRVIVRARKHAQGVAHMHPGLILHKENGEYTDEANAILREGNPLF